ncbi:hypothetical protein GP486_005607 [Trichoglossum hirsutum]|uniref:Major facilitator superfamily (MFS) profile domain-containing protein n=1 Tax=Trichoglossum hirsutum TaxID=265104 RepID=A0A9P8L8V3_9PEZI|nr:hypothetical protein GP486_005607 [Trichoglossum hirsutum]
MRGVWPFVPGRIWVDAVAQLPPNAIDNDRARTQVCLEINSQGFDWQIILVSASGFLTDSYALFATNVVLPSLAYIYWPDTTNGKPELIINCVTLAGCMVGQILFGFLADKLGRRRLYGLELVIVIFGTLGMSQASDGENKSMDILSWIFFWRFLTGLGIGAEYPLTAIITAEFADVRRRARMLAVVFLMQPVGQLLVTGVGWAALSSLGHSRHLYSLSADLTAQNEQQRSTIDSIWRCVIGVGAAPALLAILYRLTIPESPRYTMDVVRDGERALSNIRRYHNRDTLPNALMGIQADAAGGAPGGAVAAGNAALERERPNYFTREELNQYFLRDGSWRYLFATSACWFLLDFAFYGLGINSPRQLAAIWASPPAQPQKSPVAGWQDAFDPETNLYTKLFHDAKQYVITISIGSLLGSFILIYLIDKIRRKAWLVISFLILAIAFAITAATLRAVEFHGPHWLTVALYMVCQFFFNLGPNSLTFIIPAEIFPTKYRCTCYGFSAAMGKLGSIAAQLLLKRHEFSADPGYLSVAFGIFAVLMALGAAFAWAWLPDVQGKPEGDPRELRWPTLPSKPLEILANGWTYATHPQPDGEGGQILGFRVKIAALYYRWFTNPVVPDPGHPLVAIPAGGDNGQNP